MSTTSFLFILVGAFSVCKSAVVPGLYILLCPQEEKVYSSSYTFSYTIIKKIEALVGDYIIKARSLLTWKKHKQQKKTQTVHGACDLTK